MAPTGDPVLDLEKPPYRHTLRLLEALRTSDDARATVAFAEAHTDDRGTHDANGPERARLAHVMLLRGSEADVDLVRFLLRQEVIARRRDSFQGAGDTLVILSTLLIEWGQPTAADTWLFWTAKKANFDTFAGGYDIEFVFAQHEPAVVLQVIGDHGDSGDLEMLQRVDAVAVVQSLPRWRASLAARYPRTVAGMDSHDGEAWAERFGDRLSLERFGLQNARTSEARACLYERLERYDAAVREWRSAAALAESPWDKASRLQRAVTDAAKVPVALGSAVDELESLRSQIANWNGVGLGRMATQACYELAAALDGDEGARMWRTAERWRSDLTSFPLVGRRAALSAARRWGSATDVDRLQAAVDEERLRIYGDA